MPREHSLIRADDSCQMDWIIDSLPQLDQPAGLEGVAAHNPEDVWAVGSQGDSLNTRTLVEHFDGDAWSVASSPNPSSYFDAFKDVSGASTSDVWAVGWQVESQGAAAETLIAHWDGHAWSTTDSIPGALRGVLALSANDAYAVGGSPNGPLILHWDGVAWSTANLPDGIPALTQLTSISGSSSDDLWAVGPPGLPGLNLDDSLTLHWNGTNWSVAESPPGLNKPTLEDVSAAPEGVWAVGTIVDTLGRALVEYWDGDHWTERSEGLPWHSVPETILPTATQGTWLAGVQLSDPGSLSLIAKWDGATWVAAADSIPGTYLWALDEDSDGGLWAVGSSSNDAFIEHTCVTASQTGTPTPLLTITPTPGQAALGNAGCTHGIDANDGLAIILDLANLAALPCPDNADVNCSGVVDAVDALGIFRFLALLPSLPSASGCRQIGT